jgi:hypothetical protein
MSLALTVSGITLTVVVVIGVIAYAINRLNS